jgi:hypothetical protein
LGLRAQLREVLVAEIRGAVTQTARALVEDEVLSLVGEPWSRKGDSPLRRNGATTSTIYLDGQPCLLPRSRCAIETGARKYLCARSSRSPVAMHSTRT